MPLPIKFLVTALLTLAAGASAHAAGVSGQGTWETTLQGRDLDGNPATFEAWYDTTLKITWLADASYARTSGYDGDGLMSWAAAKTWAAGLNPYGSGITGWRLPTTTDTGAAGCDSSYSGTDCGFNVDTASSEMASMYYDTLGNLGYYDTSGNVQPGGGLTNTGPFTNLQSSSYWSATEYAPYPTSDAWYFNIGPGLQYYWDSDHTYAAWAVRPGDVAPVPLPAAAWLLGSGLLGLIGVARRRR